MSNILITGISGFLGCYVLQYAEGVNKKVFGLSRRPEGEIGSRVPVEMIQGDLVHLDRASKLADQFDYVIHLAGEQRDSARFHEVNALGTRKLLEALSSFKQFVLVSSVGVVGPPKSPVVDERTPEHPLPGYEHSKYLGEQAVIEFCCKRGIPYTILRPTDVFGEFSPSLPLLNLMRTIMRRRFFYLSKHRVWFNYVYAGDVAQACWEVLGNSQSANQTFQVATPLPLQDAVDIVAQELAIPSPKRRLPRSLGFAVAASLDLINKVSNVRVPFDLARYKHLTAQTIYVGEKLTRMIGFRPQVGPADGLRKLVQYYLAQGYL